MTESSNTCDTHGSADRRNCVGYAIKEVYVGNLGDDGRFNDLLRHSPNQQQSHTFCSSVDPWHRPSDLLTAADHMESGDQPGFDLFFTSGITRGLPAIVPVAMAYSTPEDAAAEIAYLEARKYPILQVEMGEEPDGQYMIPEDYAALYLQWATAIHRVDPKLKLGGPVFEGVTEDIKVWTDTQGRNSWFGRFLAYLRDHNRFDDLAFMSFEHYPYDGCETPWKNLYQEPALITHIMHVWHDDGGYLRSTLARGFFWRLPQRRRPGHLLLPCFAVVPCARQLREQLGHLSHVYDRFELHDTVEDFAVLRCAHDYA